jgi:hypothetical protein
MMKFFVLLAVVAVAVSTEIFEEDHHMLISRSAIIDEVNVSPSHHDFLKVVLPSVYDLTIYVGVILFEC